MTRMRLRPRNSSVTGTHYLMHNADVGDAKKARRRAERLSGRVDFKSTSNCSGSPAISVFRWRVKQRLIMFKVSMMYLRLTHVKCFHLSTSSLARTPLLPFFPDLEDRAAANLLIIVFKAKISTIADRFTDSEES